MTSSLFLVRSPADALLGRDGTFPQLFGVAKIAGATGVLLVLDQGCQADKWNRNSIQFGVLAS
jgi:hypothetical protein